MKLGARAARAGGDMCCPERQLGACCGCVPLRAGALALAAFFLIFDLVSVVLFTLRYYDDPFEHPEKTARCLWGEHSVLWREMRSGMQPLLRFVRPFVVALLLFYVACGVVDMALLAAAFLKSTVIMQIWVVLSLFRALHVFLDTFVVVVTCLYVNRCLHYVYPNIMSLVSLVVLLYARGVIASYAHDIKLRRRALRDAEGGPPPPAAKAPPSSGGFTTPEPGDARRSQSASSYEPAPSADKRASARLPATPKAQPDSAKPGKQLAEAPHTRQTGSPKPDAQPGSPTPKTEPVSPKPETKPGTGKSESKPGSDKSESKPVSVKSESKPGSVKSESKPGSVKSEPKSASVKSDTEPVSVESKTKTGPVKSKTEPGLLKFDKRQVFLKPDHEPDSPLSERQLVAVKLDRLGGSPKLETLSDTDSTKTRSPSRALNRDISYVLYKMHSRSLSDASPVSSVIVQTVSGLDDRVITTTTPLKGSPLQLAFGVNVGGGAASPSGSRSQRSRSHHRQRSDAARGREPQSLAPLAARRQSRARRSRSPSAAAASVYAPAPPDAPAGRLLGRTGGARVQKYPPPQRRAMPARKPRAPTKKRSMP